MNRDFHFFVVREMEPESVTTQSMDYPSSNRRWPCVDASDWSVSSFNDVRDLNVVAEFLRNSWCARLIWRGHRAKEGRLRRNYRRRNVKARARTGKL